MRTNNDLFIFQAYRDNLNAYHRSVSELGFPVWDYIFLTASNQQQADSFVLQLENRRENLPSQTVFVVIPDEGGDRIGSGGATLSVLKYLHENEKYPETKRILVIHSGGDSRRIPQYSVIGKLFSPIPHVLENGRSSTLFDELLVALAPVPLRMKSGMMLVSGDVLPLFNPLQINFGGRGAAAVSFSESVDVGKDHGVYVSDENGNVRCFLHKQSEETLRMNHAVNDSGLIDIDTGLLLFGSDVMTSLWSLVSENGHFDQNKYDRFVNSKVRLSLYGDFQYPMASCSTLEQFYQEKPENKASEELKQCRKEIWEALSGYVMKLLRIAPARFLHVGTVKEMLELMTSGFMDLGELGWTGLVNSAMKEGSGYNSVVESGASIGEGSYIESSYVHERAAIGRKSILSHVEVIEGMAIPDEVVLHQIKQKNGRYVCRIFGINDNPKEKTLFDTEIGQPLWDLKLYPECSTPQEAVEKALKIHEWVINGKWDEIEKMDNRKSLSSGFNEADTLSVLRWEKYMEEMVAVYRIRTMIDEHVPVSKVEPFSTLTPIQEEKMNEMVENADLSVGMRLHYYMGKAQGNKGDKEINAAFTTLSDALVLDNLKLDEERKDLKISKEITDIALPLRVNWAGGWTDTPPYCLENGGTVLNAAILLNGDRPVKVSVKKLDKPMVVLESSDLDVYE
ncbi:MAG: hypothetical protein IJI05_00775 [Erysipelotrichaceae bacterium]|nr:hypothetical protein [Erysipelotrichaceae bacterium]